MSTNHTPNFNLSQWEAGDKVLRTDFNADNAKIDAALAGLNTDLSQLDRSITAALGRKLGHGEIITSYKSSGNQVYGVGLSSFVKDWREWDYICALVQYPGATPADSVPLSCSFSFILDGTKVETFDVEPVALPGYLVVFLPWHDADTKVAGFILSDRLVPFSAHRTFRELSQIDFMVKDRAQKLISPNIYFFGGR